MSISGQELRANHLRGYAAKKQRRYRGALRAKMVGGKHIFLSNAGETQFQSSKLGYR